MGNQVLYCPASAVCPANERIFKTQDVPNVRLGRAQLRSDGTGSSMIARLTGPVVRSSRLRDGSSVKEQENQILLIQTSALNQAPWREAGDGNLYDDGFVGLWEREVGEDAKMRRCEKVLKTEQNP
eukprot:382003-Rhodomonas_salina.1